MLTTILEIIVISATTFFNVAVIVMIPSKEEMIEEFYIDNCLFVKICSTILYAPAWLYTLAFR